MTAWKIPLYKIYWNEDDVLAVASVIRQGMFWAIGPKITEFEQLIAEYTGRKFAVACNSGTSALHTLLLAYGINSGDEIIVPSFTFIATANSVIYVNAKPVFAEIEEETYGLDPEDVKEKITNKTKAIMPIHYGGCPCRIEELKELAEDYKLLLIEDAAESLGARVRSQPVGSFGNAAIFSFCGNKVITTGEGGMIVTDSKEVYKKIKLIRSHGRLEKENYFTSEKSFDYVTLGYNWRMSNLIAALGISQMKKLDKVVKMRRKNASYLTKYLSRINKIITPNPPRDYYHVYQMYTVRTTEDGEIRDNLREFLSKKGIMTKIYFEPVHLTQFYRKTFGYKEGDLPITERVSRKVLTLPMYPTLTKEEMNYILKQIYNFFEIV